MSPDCEWHLDSQGFVTLDEIIANQGCPLPDGIHGFFVGQSIVDKHGHELDGDHDPHGKGGCDHRDTPEWKAEHRKHKRHKMEKHDETTTTTPAPILLASNDTGAPIAATTTATTTATVGVDQAIGQIKSLLPAGTDASPGLLVGGAAGLAVVGAAIKFGPSVLKARHEAKMKSLEIEEKKAEQQEEQHGKCSVERAALEVRVTQAQASLSAMSARLDDILARLEALAQKPMPEMPEIDVDELEARLAKLEKALKPPKAAKKVK